MKHNVTLITVAGQAIGAALIDAYTACNYGVMADSITLRPTSDDKIVTVRGEIENRRTAMVQTHNG